MQLEEAALFIFNAFLQKVPQTLYYSFFYFTGIYWAPAEYQGLC